MDGPVHAADRVGLTLGNGQLPVALGVGNSPDCLGLALGLQDILLLDGLRSQDQGLLLALGAGDSRLTDPVGFEHDRPPGPLRLHLLVHGGHDVCRWVDSLDLDPDHPYAPLVGGVVEHQAQRHVDGVPGGQEAVQGHVADHVAEVGLGQLGDGHHEVGHVVDEPLCVGGLVVDDGVDGDRDVVLGYDLLGWHVDDLFAHVHADERLDHRDDQLETRVGGRLVPAQLFDDPPLEGADDLDRRCGEHEQDEGDDDQDDYCGHLVFPNAFRLAGGCVCRLSRLRRAVGPRLSCPRSGRPRRGCPRAGGCGRWSRRAIPRGLCVQLRDVRGRV